MKANGYWEEPRALAGHRTRRPLPCLFISRHDGRTPGKRHQRRTARVRACKGSNHGRARKKVSTTFHLAVPDITNQVSSTLLSLPVGKVRDIRACILHKI